MALKLCEHGHLTGRNTCWCGSKAEGILGPKQHRALSKKRKREITNALRRQGILTVADMSHG